MGQTVEDIENKMKETDVQLDSLAMQVGNIEQQIFAENGRNFEVNNLLKSVGEVKDNYQNLRKEISEVRYLQKQLGSSVRSHLDMMLTKCSMLKKQVNVAEGKKYNIKVPSTNTPPDGDD